MGRNEERHHTRDHPELARRFCGLFERHIRQWRVLRREEAEAARSGARCGVAEGSTSGSDLTAWVEALAGGLADESVVARAVLAVRRERKRIELMRG